MLNVFYACRTAFTLIVLYGALSVSLEHQSIASLWKSKYITKLSLLANSLAASYDDSQRISRWGDFDASSNNRPVYRHYSRMNPYVEVGLLNSNGCGSGGRSMSSSAAVTLGIKSSGGLTIATNFRWDSAGISQNGVSFTDRIFDFGDSAMSKIFLGRRSVGNSGLDQLIVSIVDSLGQSHIYGTTGAGVISYDSWNSWIITLNNVGIAGVPSIEIYKDGIPIVATAIQSPFSSSTKLADLSVNNNFIFRPFNPSQADSSGLIACTTRGAMGSLMLIDGYVNGSALSLLASDLTNAMPTTVPPADLVIVLSNSTTSLSLLTFLILICCLCGCTYRYYQFYYSLRMRSAPVVDTAYQEVHVQRPSRNSNRTASSNTAGMQLSSTSSWGRPMILDTSNRGSSSRARPPYTDELDEPIHVEVKIITPGSAEASLYNSGVVNETPVVAAPVAYPVQVIPALRRS